MMPRPTNPILLDTFRSLKKRASYQNTIQGPGVWSFDMALSRVFRFHEDQRLEFRAEAYNVTNSFRPQNPIATVNNANFGVIRLARDPRIMQFALKYVF